MRTLRADPHRGDGRFLCRDRGRGTASSVFSEMTRIVTEQGVDEAIAYVAEQRPSIMKAVHARRKQNRADLQPLLQAAGLHEAKGQAAEARSLYTDILDVEPDWPRRCMPPSGSTPTKGTSHVFAPPLLMLSVTTKKLIEWPSA